MKRDNEIFDIIDREHLRQRRGIELIASENFVSDEVMRAMGSCLTNKYAEGYPAHRYYGGCQVVDEAENLAIERAKKLFDAEWANVQPHSGAQANMAVFMACLQPGDKFMGMDLSHGGHLSHGSPVNFSGLMFEPISYTVRVEDGRVNYEEMEEKAARSVLNSSSPVPAPIAANGIMPAYARSLTRSARYLWLTWLTPPDLLPPDYLKIR